MKTKVIVENHDENGNPTKIVLRNVWNKKSLVEIELNGKKTIQLGSEVIKAIEKCMNCEWPFI